MWIRYTDDGMPWMVNTDKIQHIYVSKYMASDPDEFSFVVLADGPNVVLKRFRVKDFKDEAEAMKKASDLITEIHRAIHLHTKTNDYATRFTIE